jgi:hypothetical protein
MATGMQMATSSLEGTQSSHHAFIADVESWLQHFALDAPPTSKKGDAGPMA